MTVSQRKAHGKAELAYAIRSFVGYLEGTEKAAHTIKNYRSDLTSFQTFIQGTKLSKLTREDIEAFHTHLKAQGLKTNTRRRKVLTIRRFFRYLSQRKKIDIDVGRKLPAPHKVERVPFTVPYADLIRAIEALPAANELQARNRVLLWTLAETACLVSEAPRLRFDDWSAAPKDGARVALGGGKSPRTVAVSRELFAAVQQLRAQAGERPWLFLGFNKFGTLGSPISPRGIELLVKVYAARLGIPELTPRTFRHSTVLYWLREGISRDEVQKRLGLKTAYAFRSYEPMLT